MVLRERFDQIAEGVEGYANLIAERLVQLGGLAEGTMHAVTERSALGGSGLARADGKSHLGALATALTDFGRYVHDASVQASDLHAGDTAALFTEIGCGIDTWLWFVQTSQQPGS